MLQGLRKEGKFTQKKLSELIGVHRKTIIGWESGEFSPSSQYYPMLCGLLRVSEGRLLQAIKVDAINYRINKYSEKIEALRQELEELTNGN
jgi:transcriptional regulator with XRE-family HTH domain